MRFQLLLLAPAFFGRSRSPLPPLRFDPSSLLLFSRQFSRLEEAAVVVSESSYASACAENCMRLRSTCRFSSHALSTSTASRGDAPGASFDGSAPSGLLMGGLATDSPPGLCVAVPGAAAARFFIHSAQVQFEWEDGMDCWEGGGECEASCWLALVWVDLDPPHPICY